MKHKYLAVKETILPIDYDHNDRSSQKGYHQWRNYVTTQLAKDLSPMMFFYVQCQKILAEKVIIQKPKPMPTKKYNMPWWVAVVIQVATMIILLTCIYLKMEVFNG